MSDAEKLIEAREIIQQLLDEWPAGGLPSAPLLVRAAKMLTANPTLVALDDRRDV